jgi:hypothetical protein
MTSSITVHLKKRMEERFNLKLNRKSRLEVVQWIEKQPWTSLGVIKDTRYPQRYIINMPLFLCKTLRETNENLKWGNRAIVVYDKNLHRILTAWQEEENNGQK